MICRWEAFNLQRTTLFRINLIVLAPRYFTSTWLYRLWQFVQKFSIYLIIENNVVSLQFDRIIYNEENGTRNSIFPKYNFIACWLSYFDYVIIYDNWFKHFSIEEITMDNLSYLSYNSHKIISFYKAF